MSSPVLRWAAGGLGSVAAHGLVLWAIWGWIQPDPVTPQPLPKTELQLEAFALDRMEAQPAEPEADPAAEGEARGSELASGAIRQTRAAPVAPRSDAAPSAGTGGAALPVAEAPSQPLHAAPPPAAAMSAAALPDARPTPSRAPEAPPIEASLPPQTAARATAPQPETARPVAVATATAQPAAPTAAAISPNTPSAQPVQPSREPSLQLQASTTERPASQPVSTQSTPTPAASSAAATVAPTVVPSPEVQANPVPAQTLMATNLPPTARLSPAPASPTPKLASATPQSLALAQARPTPAAPQRAAIPDAPSLLQASLSTAPINDAAPEIPAAAAVALPRLPLSGSAIDSPTQPAKQAALQPLSAQRPAAAALKVAARPAPKAPAVEDSGPVATAVVPTAVATAEAAPAAEPLARAEPDVAVADRVAPTLADTPSAPATGARLVASLAFPGQESGDIDPVSLAAFQSFMQPGDLRPGSDTMRDGIAGLLAQVPCSRLQVGFDPDSVTLTVSGHIPDPALRAQVVGTLQDRMGTNIAVADQMKILGRPQCGALSGVANMGLPNSTNLDTDARLIGNSVQAQDFRFLNGQRLHFNLEGPDYDAWVYVDYFDANGNVLHLTPNDTVPLQRIDAKGAFRVGTARDGDPGLTLIVGPPYGDEIAVSFATSHPLYDGLRPIVEPAGPYLDWVRDRVTEARARHPDFKGEWVYFFVTTAAE